MMKTKTTVNCLSILFVLFFFLPVTGQTTDTLRVLMVGNSYTFFNYMPQMLEEMLGSSEEFDVVDVQVSVAGGFTFQEHWESSQTREKIQLGWDYVILQEQSMRPIRDPQKMHQYGRLLIAGILAIGAKPFLFMTWPRQSTPEKMKPIREAYENLSADSVTIIPAGLVWQQLNQRFPHINFYRNDGSHPNVLGSLVTALVCSRIILKSGYQNITLPDSVNIDSVNFLTLRQRISTIVANQYK